MDPAPKRSESELDMVAEIMPANSSPQISAGMVLIQIAERAEQVVEVVAGIPIFIKKDGI